MEKRKSIKSKWTSGKRTSTRKARKRHQNGTQEPKIGPKKAVNGTTRGQKSSQEGPKRVQKRSQTASRTKKRTKTPPRPSWDPPRGRAAPLSLTFRGPFGHPKTAQNGSENEQKSKRKRRVNKKRSKRIKDPSWSDLGPFGGAMWEPEGPKSIGKRTISCTITFSKIRRFEDGFGTNLGRPGRQKERKGPPRGTQDRPQNRSKPISKSSYILMRKRSGHEWN